jgi:hypothetical protein
MLVSTIEQRLRDRCEAVVEKYLPAAKKDGNFLKASSTIGQAGDSLIIWIKGPSRGTWHSFLSGEHGDMLDLIEVTQRLCSKADAVAEAKNWLLSVGGMQPHEDSFQRNARHLPAIDPAESRANRRRRVSGR